MAEETRKNSEVTMTSIQSVANVTNGTSNANNAQSVLREFRIMKKKPESTGEMCCVVGCSNRRGKDTLMGIKRSYHRFPAESKGKRRQLWINAVPRTDWTPTKTSAVCGDHFVGGRASCNPNSPAYVPSIFPAEISPASEKTVTTDVENGIKKSPVSLLKRPAEETDHDYTDPKRASLSCDQKQLSEEEELRLREQVLSLQHIIKNETDTTPLAGSTDSDDQSPACCTVSGCYNQGGHNYPTDDERRNAWVIAVNRVPNRFRKLWRPPLSAIVCHAHFKPTDYVIETDSAGVTTRRLCDDAIPSVFPWSDEVASSSVRKNKRTVRVDDHGIPLDASTHLDTAKKNAAEADRCKKLLSAYQKSHANKTLKPWMVCLDRVPSFVHDTPLEKKVLQIRMKAAMEIMEATVKHLEEEETRHRKESLEQMNVVERIVKKEIFDPIRARDVLRIAKVELESAMEPEVGEFSAEGKSEKKLLTVQPTSEDIFDPMAATMKYRVAKTEGKEPSQPSPTKDRPKRKPKGRKNGPCD